MPMPSPIVVQSTPSSLLTAACAATGGSGFGLTAQVGWPGATGVDFDCESTTLAPGALTASDTRGRSAASLACSPRRS